MLALDQGGGKRRAGIVLWRPQKSLVSEGILSSRPRENRFGIIGPTNLRGPVRRRGMKARPPVGGFAFFSLGSGPAVNLPQGFPVEIFGKITGP